MSDDSGQQPEERKRPNANYSLSKTDARPDEIRYHYDRDRRLEKAPKSVRELYYKKEDEQPRRIGMFRLAPLGGRFQVVLMVFILLISLMALITTLIGRDDDTHDFEGNRITVQAIRYEQMVIMALRKIHGTAPVFALRPARALHVGEVDIEVSPAGAPSANVSFHRVTFTEESPEFFRFVVPFDSDELELVFATEGRTLSVRVRVE